MRPRRRVARLTPVLALALAIVLAGCGSTSTSTTATSPAASPAPVMIGAIYPTSGAQGAGGTEELHGVELAVESANAHGGFHGRPYRLVPVDAERAEAVPAAMTSLHRQGISVVVGSHSSEISAVAAQEATRYDMAFFETGAVGDTSADVAGAKNFFRLSPMGANLGRNAIAFVHNQLAPHLPYPHPLRYAVAYVDDPYGRSVGLGAVAEIQRAGLPSAAVIPYNASTADFSKLAKVVADSAADVLFVAAYLPDGVALRRALVTQHVPLLASIGTSSSYCQPQFGVELGSDAVGLFASDKPDAAHVNRGALTGAGQAALDWVSPLYERRFGQPMSAYALSGFSNGTALFGYVLPAAGSVNANAVAVAARATKFPEGTLANGGGLDIAPQGTPDAGNNRQAAGVIWEWVAPRTSAVVWPAAYATHPITALPLSGSPRPWPNPS